MLGSRHREAGFSVIEIVVALLIMSMVGAALAQAVTVSSRTQTKQKVRGKQLAVAEGVFQKLQIDTQWFDPARGFCPAMPVGAPEVTCINVKSLFAADPLLTDARLALEVPLALEVAAVGLDSNADGVGLRDEDGTRPDYFRVSVTVSVTGRAADFKPITVTGTINPAARGGTGSLLVQICSTRRQYDLRHTMGGCPQPFDVQMEYPAGSATSGTADWNAMLDRLSPAAGAVGQDMLTYEVVPVATSFTAKRREGPLNTSLFQPQPGRGCAITAADTFRCNTSTAVSTDPLYPTSSTVASGLPPGTYDIVVAPPAGYEMWPHMSVPAGGVAVVEAGTRSRTIVMLRPVNVNGYVVDLEECDITDPTNVVCTPGTPVPIAVYMVPSSQGRAVDSFDPANSAGEAKAATGDTQITINGLAPGLYIPHFKGVAGEFDADKTSAGNTELLWNGQAWDQDPALGTDLWGSYVWIDPIRDGLGYDVPDSANLAARATFTIRNCDDPGRNLLIATLPGLLGIPPLTLANSYQIPATAPFPWGGRSLWPCSPAAPPTAQPQNDGAGGT